MILVTTAGKVGAQAARLLAEAGHPARLLVRSATSRTALEDAGVELFVGDLDHPEDVEAAVAGVSSIILVTAPSPRQEDSVIRAARDAGVGHITKITVDASADSPIARRRDHYAIEQTLAQSGVDHTLLRSNAYMQNFLALAPVIAATSRFASPAADGRIGMVDAADVAETAATVAAYPERYVGATYRLSGPAALFYDDVADQLSDLLGQTVTHDKISVAEQEATLLSFGMPAPVARANAQALGLFAQGDSDWTSADVEHVTGRSPHSFADFAAAHLDAFRRPA